MTDENQANTLMGKFLGSDAKTRTQEHDSTTSFQPNMQLIREREKAIIEQLRQEVMPTAPSSMSEENIALVRARMREMVEKDQSPLSARERSILNQSIIDEVFGFGPLTPLLRDLSVQNICVNGPNSVYLERDGKYERSSIVFENDRHIRDTIEKILQPLKLRLDENSPIVKGRMPNGASVVATLSPVSIDGTTLTICCGRFNVRSLGQIAETGTMSFAMASLLRAYAREKINVLISGFTDTGRSTLLGAMSGHFDQSQRVVSVERTAHLRLQHEHWVRLEAVRGGDGKQEVSMSDLLATASRMSPDRIILGEWLGTAGHDFLQSLNTGRNGDMAVVTARSAKDCVRRLEIMTRASGVPADYAQELIADNVQVIIQVARMTDNTYKVSEITEVAGLENSQISLTSLYQLKHEGPDEHGQYKYEFVDTGNKSRFVADFETYTSSLELYQSSMKFRSALSKPNT